ncbi:MAG: AAA family ATPase [Leptospiraceae bacterium]|nr:AAA family ATPase [Leptospiraceae bacterium]MCP5495301.1 AAA family ATPase [Leptospiraceae bacterium]
MLIKNIKLSNFRIYKGEQKVTFSTNKKENVTVVLGDNSCGKTTLIQAFQWVLYEKIHHQWKKNSLLNSEVKDQLESNETSFVKVSIEIEHRKESYTISRTQEYGRKGPVTPSVLEIQCKEKDGQTKSLQRSEYGNIINDILPEELSIYFFFDGEKIATISNNQREGKEEIENAIKRLLGFKQLSNALEHLKQGGRYNVIGKLKSSFDTETDEELMETQKELNESIETLNKIKAYIQELKKSETEIEKKVKEKEDSLKENEESGKLQNQKERNDEEIKRSFDNMQSKVQEIRTIFSKNAFIYCMLPLLDKAKEFIEDKELSDDSKISDDIKKLVKGKTAITVDLIDDLLKEEMCICGSKIKEDSTLQDRLIRLKKFVKQGYNQQIDIFKERIDKYIEDSEGFGGFQKRYKEYREEKIKREDLKKENHDIIERLKGRTDSKHIQKEIEELGKQKRRITQNIEENRKKEGELGSLIDRLEIKLKKYQSDSKKNKLMQLRLEYAKRIYEKIQEFYKKEEDVIKIKLEEKANEIFSELYHGERTIKIGDRYKLELLVKEVAEDNDQNLDIASGLEVVAGFTFILGIISMVKENILTRESNEYLNFANNHPYPLVMDAPFSNLDDKHIENISIKMPEIAEQVIMFIMEKDWHFAQKNLYNKVGKIYQLNKKNERHTVVGVKNV